MAITPTLYDTRTLLGVMSAQEPPSNYWLSLCFPNEMRFEDEYIDFEKLQRPGRRLAPFVAPNVHGKPLFREGSTVTRLKPAYIKPNDPISPSRALRRRPGELAAPVPMSPAARMDAIRADILAQHRDAIERRWEWLAARAIIDGSVTIADDASPARTVSFGRASAHTVTLGSGARWGDSGVKILDNIQSWIDTMADATYGGPVTRITVGTAAWAVMKADAEVQKQLNSFTRGTVADLTTGVLAQGTERFVRYAGMIGEGLPVYVYNDWYEDDSGSVVRILDPKSVVLTGPAVDGYRCFGAIIDPNAQYQPLPIFPRNYVQPGDPAFEAIVSQSSPLMVPVNPDQTFKARVLA